MSYIINALFTYANLYIRCVVDVGKVAECDLFLYAYLYIGCGGFGEGHSVYWGLLPPPLPKSWNFPSPPEVSPPPYVSKIRIPPPLKGIIFEILKFFGRRRHPKGTMLAEHVLYLYFWTDRQAQSSLRNRIKSDLR